MGNSDHGTSHIREGGDEGELRPRHVTQGRQLENESVLNL